MACGKVGCLFGTWKDAIEVLRQELEVNNPFTNTFNDTKSRPQYPSITRITPRPLDLEWLPSAVRSCCPRHSLDPDKGMHCSGRVVSRTHAFERHVADIFHTLDL